MSTTFKHCTIFYGSHTHTLTSLGPKVQSTLEWGFHFITLGRPLTITRNISVGGWVTENGFHLIQISLSQVQSIESPIVSLSYFKHNSITISLSQSPAGLLTCPRPPHWARCSRGCQGTCGPRAAEKTARPRTPRALAARC